MSSANCVIDANTGKIIGGSIEKIKKMDNIEMYFNQVDETFELYPSHDMQSIGGANGGFTGPSIGTIYIKNVKPKEIIKDLTADDISIDESIYDTDDETTSTHSNKSFEDTEGSRAALQSEHASKQRQEGAPLVYF